MTDTSLRQLERQAAAGDPSAQERLARAMERVDPSLGEARRAAEGEARNLARVNRVFEYLWNNGDPLLDGLDWYDGLAGEDSDGPVIVANWNNRDRYHPYHGPVQPGRYLGGIRVDTDTTPSRALRILERLGADCRWSDGYLRCDCGKGFSTEPDCWSWRQEDYGRIWDGDYACADCIEDMRCEECGEPDIGGHCHQLPETHGPDGWTTAGWCHCGHGCEHDETEEED